jgi:hypothetical protein
MFSISYTTGINVQNTGHSDNSLSQQLRAKAWKSVHNGGRRLCIAEIFRWSDVRMALRYTHATDESKRRAVENLAKPIGPSDESVTNEKGRVLALP